jgi:hypothetical protein
MSDENRNNKNCGGIIMSDENRKGIADIVEAFLEREAVSEVGANDETTTSQ